MQWCVCVFETFNGNVVILRKRLALYKAPSHKSVLFYFTVRAHAIPFYWNLKIETFNLFFI